MQNALEIITIYKRVMDRYSVPSLELDRLRCVIQCGKIQAPKSVDFVTVPRVIGRLDVLANFCVVGLRCLDCRRKVT